MSPGKARQLKRRFVDQDRFDAQNIEEFLIGEPPDRFDVRRIRINRQVGSTFRSTLDDENLISSISPARPSFCVDGINVAKKRKDAQFPLFVDACKERIAPTGDGSQHSIDNAAAGSVASATSHDLNPAPHESYNFRPRRDRSVRSDLRPGHSDGFDMKRFVLGLMVGGCLTTATIILLVL